VKGFVVKFNVDERPVATPESDGAAGFAFRLRFISP
jgi:hypothetical protein